MIKKTINIIIKECSTVEDEVKVSSSTQIESHGEEVGLDLSALT